MFYWFFICVQSVSEFLWDGLHASIEFPVMPKHAQYARFGGEDCLRRKDMAWGSAGDLTHARVFCSVLCDHWELILVTAD
eukprot:COSAG02_NODE_779_length_17271_cov_30.596261_7_plen_80_part_00